MNKYKLLSLLLFYFSFYLFLRFAIVFFHTKSSDCTSCDNVFYSTIPCRKPFNLDYTLPRQILKIMAYFLLYLPVNPLLIVYMIRECSWSIIVYIIANLGNPNQINKIYTLNVLVHMYLPTIKVLRISDE